MGILLMALIGLGLGYIAPVECTSAAYGPGEICSALGGFVHATVGSSLLDQDIHQQVAIATAVRFAALGAIGDVILYFTGKYAEWWKRMRSRPDSS